MSQKTNLTKLNAAISQAKRLAAKHPGDGYIVYSDDESTNVIIERTFIVFPEYEPGGAVCLVTFDPERGYDIAYN